MNFHIQFDPPIANAPAAASLPDHFKLLPSLEALYENMGYNDKYSDCKNNVNITVFVHGTPFSEGACYIYTQYLTLCEEWANLEMKRSHEIDLVGYPVLGVAYEEGRAQFYELTGDFENRFGATVGPPIAVEEVREELRRAILALWARMQEITASG